MNSYEIEIAINNLICLMEVKLEDIRFNLDRIDNQQELSDVVKYIKKEIEGICFNFENVSDGNVDKLNSLKQEYLLLVSFYE